MAASLRRWGPAVVFLLGVSALGLDYLNVHDQAAKLTTSVICDRGGTGWSDSAELPRTAAEVAAELRDLLHAADLPGPYLLVAHSLGDAYARRFAQLFSGQPAGALYLDAFYRRLHAQAPAPGPAAPARSGPGHAGAHASVPAPHVRQDARQLARPGPRAS